MSQGIIRKIFNIIWIGTAAVNITIVICEVIRPWSGFPVTMFLLGNIDPSPLARPAMFGCAVPTRDTKIPISCAAQHGYTRPPPGLRQSVTGPHRLTTAMAAFFSRSSGGSREQQRRREEVIL